MAVYITGDIHGELGIGRLSSQNWTLGKTLTRNDYLVILGDFGLIWDLVESKREKYWLDWLENKPWTTLFIDGNHENFARLNSEFEVKEWHGGKIHEIRPHIYHLMRGEIFNLDGYKCLAFGGAASVDRADRIEDISWWAAEMPSDVECAHCVENLIANGDKVDVVFTHEAPAVAFWGAMAGVSYGPDKLAYWLQGNIAEAVEFKRWYFGHHHIDRTWTKPYTPVFEDIVKMELDKDEPRSIDGQATADYERVWGGLA